MSSAGTSKIVSPPEPSRLAILTYHSLDESGSVVSVAPQLFARQIALIAAYGFRVSALGEVINYRRRHGSWPPKTVVITFDDGFSNVHEVALPILAHYNFSATVFLITDFIGKRNSWERPLPALGEREILDWSQVNELVSANFEMGSHTRRHPDLTKLASEQINGEIVESRVELQSRLGRAVETFAYPYGRVNRTVREIVERHYDSACTTKLKRAGTEAFTDLPRVDMYYVKTPADLALVIQGKLDNYLAVRCACRWTRAKLSRH